MARHANLPRIDLPRGWPRHVKSALLQWHEESHKSAPYIYLQRLAQVATSGCNGVVQRHQRQQEVTDDKSDTGRPPTQE
jgi:hypothetical protein